MELPWNKLTVSAEPGADLQQEPLGLPRPWSLRLGRQRLSLPSRFLKPAAPLTAETSLSSPEKL